MEDFEFQARTRFIFGAGIVSRLGELARELGLRRAFVVSDPGVVEAGHFNKGALSLVDAGLEVCSFHDLHENPSTEDVDRGLYLAREFSPDLIIGLGGGSSMDCAKGINFLLNCGGKMSDYWGIGKATKNLLPMFGVPTTAGTGSEAQSFALISDAETHVKMACGDPRAACRIAILDPELTLTMPRRVTALTGIDALTHALETYLTTRQTPMSRLFSREAWRLLSSGLPVVLSQPDDLEARGKVQWGACLAGMAIENSMLGVCHALANPLTANFGIVHGQAVGLMMPHVIRWNGELFAKDYRDLWRDHVSSNQPLSNPLDSNCETDAVEGLANWVQNLVREAGLETHLSAWNPQAFLPKIAEEAVRQWTASFNPRPVTQEAAKELYTRAI